MNNEKNKINSRIEKNNLNEINRLNQRGNRMLSIIDLLNDNTLDANIAAYLLKKMQENISFLTCALQSGTGKTTLMASMLNLIKPGIKIKSIEEIPENIRDNTLYLVHEIGSGPYYSYLWGEQAEQFFRLTNKASIATGLHANSMERLKQILFQQLNVHKKIFKNIKLILFMNIINGKRRITEIFEINNNEFSLISKFNKENNKFENSFKIKSNYKEFIEKLKNKNTNHLENIRKEFLKWKQKDS